MACQRLEHEEFMSSKLELTNLNDSSLSSFVFFIASSTHPQYANHVLKLCIITPEIRKLPYYESHEKNTMRIEDLEEETRVQCLVHNAMLPMRVCPELLLMGHIQKEACLPFLSNLSGNNEVDRIKHYVMGLREFSLGYIVMELISPVYGTLHYFDQYHEEQLLDRSLRVFALLMSIFIKTKLCNTDAHFGNAFALKKWNERVFDPIKIIDFGRVAHVDTYKPIFIDMDRIPHDYKIHGIAKTSKKFSEGLTHDYRVEELTTDSLYRAIRHYVIIDYESTPDRIPKCIDLLMEVFPHVKHLSSRQFKATDMFSDEWFGRGDPECEEHLQFILHLIQTQEGSRHEKVLALQRESVTKRNMEVEDGTNKRAHMVPVEPRPASRSVEPRPASRSVEPRPASRSVEPRPASRSVEPRPVGRSVEQGRTGSRPLGLLSSALTDNQPDEYRPTVAPLTASIHYRKLAGAGMFVVGCAVAYLMSRGGSKRKCCHCKPRKTCKTRRKRLL